MGGVPDKEAHGGYTFCGISALALLGSTGNCNLDSLLVCEYQLILYNAYHTTYSFVFNHFFIALDVLL